MASRGKRLVRALVGWGCICVGKATARLPLWCVRATARALAAAAYYCVPRVQRVGRANLDLAYGDALSAAEKRRILRGAVVNAALTAFEFTRIPRLTPAQLERYITVRGGERLEPGQPAICIGAHLGNWEWLGPAGAAEGQRISIIVRPLRHRPLNTYVDRIRRSTGVLTLDKDASMASILRTLKDGGVVGLLVDQCPAHNGVPAHFFGRPAWSAVGPAMLVQRTGVPVYPIAMVRQAGGRYEYIVEKPLAMADTGDKLADLQENTQRCQDAVEALIREYPDQWLWFHRRWKKRAKLERQWAERLTRHAAAARTEAEEAAAHAVK